MYSSKSAYKNSLSGIAYLTLASVSVNLNLTSAAAALLAAVISYGAPPESHICTESSVDKSALAFSFDGLHPSGKQGTA
jgi:hypothetical protein